MLQKIEYYKERERSQNIEKKGQNKRNKVDKNIDTRPPKWKANLKITVKKRQG